jgi:diguanylate cyclase (GGDEF)-like protein
VSGGWTVSYPLVRQVHLVRQSLVVAVLILSTVVWGEFVLGSLRQSSAVLLRLETHGLSLLVISMLALALVKYKTNWRLYFVTRILSLLSVILVLTGIELHHGVNVPVAIEAWFNSWMPDHSHSLPGLTLPTELALLCVSLGILLRHKAVGAGLVAATLALWIPVISLIGYSYGQSSFFGAMSLTSVALVSPLALATLSLYAHHNYIRPFLSNRVSGKVLRSQVLLALVVPWAVGFLLLRGSHPESLQTVPLFIALVTWFIWIMVYACGRAMEKIDRNRRSAERRFARQALCDPLTGARNRRGALLETRAALGDARTGGSIMSLIMVDLDDFKKVNDQFGHRVGDEVLVRVSRLLSKSLRPTDILARWGGEEFLILLPETRLDVAVEIAERLRATLETDMRLSAEGGSYDITGSFGVAEVGQGEVGLYEGLICADQALYRAKDQGRNMVAEFDGVQAEDLRQQLEGQAREMAAREPLPFSA